MIVVCGSVGQAGLGDGVAAAIAGASAAAGAPVQVISIVPDGAEGDRQLIELAAKGIGHAAVLRTGPRPLEPADVELALRYLPDVRVVVAVEGDSRLDRVLADGAAYSGATLVVVGDSASGARSELPDSAIVLAAPAEDPDGTFAGFVGAFATRLDGGTPPADAWQATVRELAVDPITPGPGRRLRTARG